MELCKEDNARILRRLFILILFTVFVLSFSESHAGQCNSGVQNPEKHELVFTGIIPVNFQGLYNQYDSFVSDSCSREFPFQDKIDSYNRDIERHFLVIRQTRILLGSDQALKSLFHSHYNKDDLPDLG